MYYDAYERRGRRRRRSCTGWLMAGLFRLVLLVLVIAVLAAALLYALPVALMNVEPTDMQLSPTNGLPASRLNVLLLGVDAMNDTGQRSDAMIVASIGYGGARLTSLMRDTVVDIPGHGRQKLNAAYAYGGPELAMRTINETFHLNITNYVTADFRALVDVIDALGGVDVELSQAEIKYLNPYAAYTCGVLLELDAEKYAHYTSAQPIFTTGTAHLNGLFATAYSRIRYSDSDYVRTSRQREVLAAMVAQFRQRFWNPLLYARLLRAVRDSIQTNLSLPELISLGEKVLISGEIESFRLPLNDYLRDNGSTIEITDMDATLRALHEFIYD